MSSTPDRRIGRLPILTWHAVDDTRSVISIPPQLFRWQMDTLAELGLRGISLAEAFAHHERHGAFRPDAVVLSFDDAYLCLAEHVLPVTRAHGFRATVFVATGFVGLSGNEAQALNADISRDVLDWAQLRQFASEGWEIGSHTMTHPDLSRLPGERLAAEIAGAREHIEREIGAPAGSFAYPYGYYNRAARSAVAAQHTRACTTRLGFNDTATDPFQLERIDVYFLRRPWLFRRACRGGLVRYLGARQWLRNLKTPSGWRAA